RPVGHVHGTLDRWHLAERLARLCRPTQAAPITIYATFLEDVSEAVVKTLEDEVAAIMAPVGFQLEWRSLDETNRVADQIVAITFHGQCKAQSLAPVQRRFTPLGRTRLEDGEILHFAEVECDCVRAYLQSGLFVLPPREREAAFGRALARVAAHELYHI